MDDSREARGPPAPSAVERGRPGGLPGIALVRHGALQRAAWRPAVLVEYLDRALDDRALDAVDALLAVPVVEMHGVDAEEAGLAVGAGLAMDAGSQPGGPGLAEGEAAGSLRPGLVEVVDVPVRGRERRSNGPWWPS